MRVAVLASGSSGNAIWVSSGSTSVLVDAGISARKILTAIDALDPDGTVDAVLVTHEHSDHVSGLRTLSRRTGARVYATAGTHAVVDRKLKGIGERAVVEAGERFSVGDLDVAPFAISHDCVEPVGYSITDGSERVVVATDLGIVTHAVRHHISQADCLVLEFNHDERMLMDGSYPWFLKQRILGRSGHLSNAAAARELISLRDCPTSVLVLAHLSRENNTPELASAAAAEALGRAGRSDINVLLAERTPADPVCLGADAGPSRRSETAARI